MSAQLSTMIGKPLRRAVRGVAPLALGVGLATCQIGELVSPEPPGTLAATPEGARDSAAVGSRPARVQKIALASTGPGTIAWTAARVRGSAWLALSAASGSTPDTLTLLLDPAGLFVGEYHDTVRITPTDGSTDSTDVAVTFAVQPCREWTLTVGPTVTDSLVPADCEAPHRADRFAKLYRFTAATAADSVTVVLRSTAFDPYVLVDSATAGGAPPLAESDRCGADPAAACVRYALLPRAGEFYVEVTSAGTGAGTGAFTLELQAPRAPAAPTGPAQFAGDSVTPVAVGATISNPAFVARATTSDPDLADSVALEVEVQPVGTAFGDTATATGTLVPAGGAANVRIEGLADNTMFRWQVRSRDQTGRTSAWVPFGGNAADAADIGVAVSQPPDSPTGIGQFRSDGTTGIATGATTDEATVVFKGTVSDPDPADQVRLEVEVQPFGTPFANVATGAGVLVANGTAASATVTGLLDGVAYHWQVRTVDQATQASDWVAFAASGQTSEDFRVVLPATQLAFATQPTGTTAGSPITPPVTVEARKASGVVDTAFDGTVNVVIAPGTGTSGAVLVGTVSVAAVRGVATFSNLSVDVAGTGYRLLASAAGLSSATSNTFDVSASGANRLALTTAPSASARSGIALTTQPVVQIRDAGGNAVEQEGVVVVATIASGPAGASLSGDTATTGASGSASFTQLAITGSVGSYTIRFDADGLTGVSSGTIALGPGAADPAQTTASVPGGVAGQPTTIVVTGRDGAGNPLTVGGETVAVAVSGANSASPAVTDNGNGTYTASYTPTASGSDGVAITLNSVAISGSPYTSVVAAAGGASLAFVVGPATVVAGATITPAVQVAVRDANGNTVTSSTAAITIAIGANPGGGTLAGSLTVSAVAGVATFGNLSIDKVGTGYTLTASAEGVTGATSAAFDVTPGAAARLLFTGQPTNTVAGATILPPVAVTVQDANGNTVTSSTATITVAIAANPGSGALSGALTVVAVAGVASFGDLSIDRAGVGYTLTAASTGLNGATSAAFDVEVGSGERLAFIVQPPMSGVAGAALAPAVQVAVQDDNGNTVTSSAAAITVALGANPAGGTLTGTTTVNAVNGVAIFSDLRLDRAGSGYTLTATGSGLTGTTSGSFAVTPAAAAQVAFSTQPSTVVAGAAISPAVSVTVQDAFGNTVTTSTAAVTVAIGANPTGGTLTGATTVTAASGVATFSPLSLDRAGTGYTLVASSDGLTGATSNGFNVIAGTATRVGFLVQPSTVVAGAEVTPAVQVAVQDANGNTVTSSTAGITLAIGDNPGSGTLSGTLTVAAVNGVAAFADLSIDRTGAGFTLTAASDGLTGATSAPFTVTPGADAALAFVVQPSNAVAGQPIVPAVQVDVRDALGNTVTTSTAAVTVALGTNPGGGTLSGTLTRNAVNGAATFTDLSVDVAATGYTLTASSTTPAGATSETFDIEVGSGNALAFVVQPTNAVTGAAIAPAIQVAVQDAEANTVLTATDAVTLVISTNPGGATLGGTRTVNAVNGIATFSDVYLNRSGAGYTLNALGSGLLSATSAAFDITAASTSTAISADTPDPSVTGQPVTVNYTVTVTAPGSGTPTGNVTVSDDAGATCVATVAAGTCQLTSSTSGARTLTATYAGDANFLGSTSPGVGHTVNPGATTTAITSDLPDPSVTGQTITVGYTVSVTSPGGGAPSGLVTVTAGADTCTASPAAGSCPLVLRTAGAKSVTATYGGDANYLASPASAAVPHQVDPAGTTTALTSDLPDPSVAGEAVTVSVAVTPTAPGTGVPTGAVTVSGGAGVTPCVASLSSGVGSCAITFPTAGLKSISAAYDGDADYGASTSAGAAHQVNPAPTITNITDDTPDPSAVGQPYTVTFSVGSAGGTPTGIVTVSDGTGESCFGTLAGGAGSCDLTSVTAGPKTLTASYGGDANFAASVSTGMAHTVNPASTTTAVTSSANPSVTGQPVTFTASVVSAGGAPVGSVQFQVDGVDLSTPVVLSGGTAVSEATSPVVGTHTITADYIPSSGNFAASTGTLAGGQEVDPAGTTVTITGDTPDPSTVGQPVTVSYSLAVNAPGAGAPTGNVTVSDGAGTSCTEAVAAGACSLTFTTTGTKTLTATYEGDAGFLGDASDPVTHEVVAAPTTTALSSSANPSVFGEAVSFTATVTGGGGPPTGTVQFIVDDVPFGDPVPLADGAAVSDPTTSLGVGTHTAAADYTPADGNLTASSGTLAGGQVVNVAATTTTITSDEPDPSPAGATVTVNYTVSVNAPGSGTPTGNVTVSDGFGASCSGTVAAGTCDLALMTAGAITLTTTYEGDTNFGTSSDTEPHQVGAAATVTTVTSSLNPVAIGQSVTFMATVTSPAGIPPGTVRFRVDGSDIGPAPFNRPVADGVATSNPYTPASVDTLVVTAVYTSSSTTFSGSLDTLDGGQVVTRIPTTTALVSLPNPSTFGESVTFTATVTGGTTTPTGTVQFRVDGTALGAPVNLNGSGIATTATSGLAAGSRVITAEYAGTATLASSADTLDQVVAAVGTAANIAAVTSQAVSGTVGGPAAPAPTVLVTDGFGNPVPDISVTFTPSAGSVSGSPVLTGEDGQATVTWTLGTTAGTQTLEAASAGLAGSPVVFTATAAAGAASATQSAVTAVPETVTADGVSGATITVTVLDANDNPVSGATVALAATGTGNTLTQPGAVTDASGQATGTLASTVAEAKTVTAVVDGTVSVVDDAVVTFTAGPAGVLALDDGGGQSAPVGTAVTVPPSVLVTDSLGNPVSGVAVTFVASGDGAVVTGAAATSDGAGMAAVESWTLGTTAGVGSDTLYAILGVFDTLAIPATATAGSASQLSMDQEPNNATAGDAISPAMTVRALDAFGNLDEAFIGSVSVVIEAGTGTSGAVLVEGSTTVVTAVAGVATFSNVAINLAGTDYRLRFSATGVADTLSGAFAITPGAASVDSSLVTVGSSTVSVSGTNSTTITLQAKDAFGNNLSTGGLVVVFSGTGSVPLSFTIEPSPAVDAENGTYTATFTGLLLDTVTINATIGGDDVTREPKPTIEVTL